MTVNPGYGGQKHIHEMHHKIRRIRYLLEKTGRTDVHVSVDGGVNSSNAKELADAGADVLVSGSFVTASSDPAKAISSLRV
jgi:ribulose-phosphate 3-epimerase